MKVGNDIYYVGVNDHQVDLFEGQYDVPNGMSYNSYVIMDEKIAVMDTVDAHFAEEWLGNVANVLNGAKPDYLVVQHMEPDHAANIENFVKAYPEVTVVANTKTFTMMENFFRGMDLGDRKLVVANGESLTLGKHVLTFVFAPMVHWPEVMVTYDSTDKVLFSADGFGKFGALDVEEDWDCEARRYYIGIVGKYGPQVQKLLKAASTLHIQTICPLHGPVWRTNLGYYLDKHDKWSRYIPEENGVMIVYASMYGNTESAAQALAAQLCEKGVTNVRVYDVSKTHVSYLVAEAFKYSHIVLASVTYNLNIYPVMEDFLHHLKVLNLSKRVFGIIENGSWAIKSGSLMEQYIDENLKDCKILNARMTINSSANRSNASELDALSDAIVKSVAIEEKAFEQRVIDDAAFAEEEARKAAFKKLSAKERMALMREKHRQEKGEA